MSCGFQKVSTCFKQLHEFKEFKGAFMSCVFASMSHWQSCTMKSVDIIKCR